MAYMGGDRRFFAIDSLMAGRDVFAGFALFEVFAAAIC
jgi:hypothetical protein